MKKKFVFILLMLFIFLIGISPAQEKSKDFPILKGPYLGQTPPVNKPILFAPGIVSNGRSHSSVAISPDGKELYWSGEKRKIWFTKLVNGRWTKPEVVTFCKEDSYEYDNPFITTDG